MKIFSILPLFLLAVLAVNAQEATSYRGAFAPAPTRQWTESWTNFNPKTAVYPAGGSLSSDTLQGNISVNRTLTSDRTYILKGNVYVDSAVTLTIEPGTIIRGLEGSKAALIIVRTAKLMAEGTQCKPIVFTSNRPVNTQDTALGRTPGDWSGIAILGRARHNQGTEVLIEGLPNTDPRNNHGGTDDDDNSGVLKYVRIEFAGEILSANNELNSLTMGSVGRGTTLDYIQTSFGLDDAFEWFGGSVNAKHLVSYGTFDDDFDTDNGYSGTVQYGLIIRDPYYSDASNSSGFESDNDKNGSGLTPKTSCKFYNVTEIGAFRCASNANASGVVPTSFNHRRGIRVRRNSDLKVVNSILMNNWRGLFVDDAVVSGQATQPTTVNFNEDSAIFRNNIIAGDFTTSWTGTTYNNTQSLAYENSASSTIGENALYANETINTCSLLTNAWAANLDSADYRPNLAGAGTVLDSAVSAAPSLNPTLRANGTLFTFEQGKNFGTTVTNISDVNTIGPIVVRISKPSAFTVTYNATATTSAVGGAVGSLTVRNSDFTFVETSTTITATSKPGVVLAPSATISIGYTVTRKTATSAGTNQNLTTDVVGGGDLSRLSTIATFSAN